MNLYQIEEAAKRHASDPDLTGASIAYGVHVPPETVLEMCALIRKQEESIGSERLAKENAIQQSQQHAMEARTQRETVLSILRHFGRPEEDWNALTLVKEAHEKEVQRALKSQLIEMQPGGALYRPQAWPDAWHALRDDVLSGVDGLDNDQVNIVLGMLDNYEPEAAPQQHAQTLPKWIDDAKGKDPLIDDLITHIESQNHSFELTMAELKKVRSQQHAQAALSDGQIHEIRDRLFTESSNYIRPCSAVAFARAILAASHKERANMSKLLYGVAECDNGLYPKYVDGKSSRLHTLWNHMLRRCFAESSLARRPSYAGCSIDKRFLTFQSFAAWATIQLGVEQGWQLDKDILVRGNKVYGPDTCIFVPPDINRTIRGPQRKESGLPVGVTRITKSLKYRASVCIDGRYETVGFFVTVEETRRAHLRRKSEYLNTLADRCKAKIPHRLYAAMVAYIPKSEYETE